MKLTIFSAHFILPLLLAGIGLFLIVGRGYAAPVQQTPSVPRQVPLPSEISSAPASTTSPFLSTPLPAGFASSGLNQQAYQQIAQEAAPLSPLQIKALRRLVDEAERAAAAPPRFTPKPVSSTVTVSLMPGETPPVVRLFANYVTNLLFIDQLGNPLNVTAVDTGGAATFKLNWSRNPAQASNLIKLSPQSTYAQGNLSVSLKQVPTPVSLTLISGQREVDYRVDVRVKGVGPTSQLDHIIPSIEANPVWLGLLAGIAPDGAQTLVSSHAEVQAWVYQNRFYVRTRYALLSPAYVGMQKSADGTCVYEIPPTSVLLALAGERAVQVQLSGD